MLKYCLGFVFRNNFTEVLLIKKNHPKWQNGKYNGLGGQVKLHETSLAAMSRECKEEAGIILGGWHNYAMLSGDNFEMEIFYCHHLYQNPSKYARSMTDEKIKWFSINKLPINSIPNFNMAYPNCFIF